MYTEREEKTYTFRTLMLDEGDWLASRNGRFSIDKISRKRL
jgi:hypothetical protein